MYHHTIINAITDKIYRLVKPLPSKHSNTTSHTMNEVHLKLVVY